jgi:type II secretory pathway pseudopilin PulG
MPQNPAERPAAVIPETPKALSGIFRGGASAKIPCLRSGIACRSAHGMTDGERSTGSPGYTFPLMLVILAAMAFGASRLELAESYRLRRDKEEELLFRGQAYMQAIKAYHQQNQQYPRRLGDLAGDQPGKGHHIRQLYKDPMTGRDFKPILKPDGTIIGVVSASRDAPFRKVDFEKELKAFEKAKSYADWKFLAEPEQARETAEASGQNLLPVTMSPF